MPLLDPGSPSSSSTSSKRSAYYVIERADSEDARRLVDIEFQAFENERANQQLSFRDYTKPEHFERSVELYTTAISSYPNIGSPLKRPQAYSRVSFLKVTDTETSYVVSFAKTEFKQYTLQELQCPADAGHEHEPRMNRDWFALNERLRREYVGLAKHCYLGMLATQPCFQHNGAGTMLLDVILAEADESGLEVYLEGTDTAKPLYEKHGFVAVNEVRFDPAEYGVCDIGRERQTVLVRGALGKDRVRRGVRSWEVAVAQAEWEVQKARLLASS
ncbi:hypothetical protein LTR35_011367 [Friedmanniomyces endolithicus]|uniref:N-acetyltransferase domain-containing protein n=1 Tax=Friedmanniomyces endolithicus TaxID=329885 RepID=A0AAN6J604_9PEZI|nr:hypothetical protein LTR35_011367 [Friedmanniomyces endolithicus]KAK0291590.1 hypothetical protein LTS00_008282 [Friedmanniomyces endolithicus]KAK0317739.1 hypothetical protein LTR82_011256 [Friedmanniomyces endolithicus]KAK0995083.1 hypothetical protein LTR54_010590 [Friedmanniomyces endolithicus]